jgi:hypothetical protein
MLYRLAPPGLLQKMVGRWRQPLPQSSLLLAPARFRFRSFHESLITSHKSRFLVGEEKSNRDNPKFKNRRNPMNPNDITFSNRDKNTLSGSPHLRFTLRDEGPHHVSSRQFTSHESRVTSHGFEFVTGIRNRSKLLKGWTDDGF